MLNKSNNTKMIALAAENLLHHISNEIIAYNSNPNNIIVPVNTNELPLVIKSILTRVLTVAMSHDLGIHIGIYSDAITEHYIDLCNDIYKKYHSALWHMARDISGNKVDCKQHIDVVIFNTNLHIYVRKLG